MDQSCRLFVLNLLRSARATAIADSEGFAAPLHSLELFGQIFSGRILNLKRYQEAVTKFAKGSPLAVDIPRAWPAYHTKFDVLYDEIRRARNDAMHQGSRARTLTTHLVEMTVILEDALLSDATTVSHFMVRDVIEARVWQPISYVRQQMLAHAFSYIPVFYNEGWRFVAESSMARYLRGSPQGDRAKRLETTLEAAVRANQLQLLDAVTVTADTPIAAIMEQLSERPIVITDSDRKEVLLGILTAADIL